MTEIISSLLINSAQHMKLSAILLTIETLDLAIFLYGAGSLQAEETAHRLRDLVGPGKHG